MDRFLTLASACRPLLVLGAIFVSYSSADAQVNVKPFPAATTPPIPGKDVPFFKDTEWGAYPHHGQGLPGEGYLHRDYPDSRYGIWYRPHAVQGQDGWCQSDGFNPRGRGYPQHLTCHRMDYSPYRLSVPYSQYGPFYYPQVQKYNCCHQNGCMNCKQGFFGLKK